MLRKVFATAPLHCEMHCQARIPVKPCKKETMIGMDDRSFQKGEEKSGAEKNVLVFLVGQRLLR